MPDKFRVLSGLFVALATMNLQAATLYVNQGNPNPHPPYATWDSAATIIQHAVDAASDGDTVLVTNGVYAEGGKVMIPDQTNRVALDKAITVRSVNGPHYTIIQGQLDPAVFGPAAMRCAWLTNGAVLDGFTLRGGSTAAYGPHPAYASGGGVWCTSEQAVVRNCVITQNQAKSTAGGACDGTLDHCIITGNSAWDGTASVRSILNYCLVQGNYMNDSTGVSGGSAVRAGVLNHCTVTANYGKSESLLSCSATNSIVWNNTGGNFVYYKVTMDNSCSFPLPRGEGNITNNPKFSSDGAHLSENSPCRARGTPLGFSNTDIDGQSIATVPSIGCDEWHPEPVATSAPTLNQALTERAILLIATVGGQNPFEFSWVKDGSTIFDDERFIGTGSETLLLRNLSPEHAGRYQFIARNSYGSITSQVASVRIHCVDVAGALPNPPYSGWTTAATNIQDAADVALDGEVVLVAKGIYATGGRAIGGLTNRVAINKPILVFGVDGPATTVIQGQWDPVSTNGPAAIRCAFLNNGATMSGFTFEHGATLAKGPFEVVAGGGVCSSEETNFFFRGSLFDCVLTDNAAAFGGGAKSVYMSRCSLSNNIATSCGGGCAYSYATNCLLVSNTAAFIGGGGYLGELFNCTVVNNYAEDGFAGFTENVSSNTCVLWRNQPSDRYQTPFDPLFVDAASGDFRLKPNSPCINAGKNWKYAPPIDMDGNPRIVGGTMDRGAYECQAPALVDYYTWLEEHLQPTDSASDSRDPDGDRLTNWQEWISGTDPTNSALVLVLKGVARSQAGNTVSWQSVAGRTYQIQRATNLLASPAFLPLADGIPGQPLATSFTDPNPPASAPVFYRVSVQP